MNTYILESLHHLLSCNVIGDKQYDNRYKGFHGELDFINWFNTNRNPQDLYAGGYFIPRSENSSTLDNPVYMTIESCEPNDEYVQIYKLIANIAPRLFYIYFDY